MDGKLDHELLARFRLSDMKPQCLVEHLQAVSGMTGQLAGKVGLEGTGHLIGLIHDLGKASVEFQEYMKYRNGLLDEASFDTNAGKLDHSTAGAQVVYERFLKPDGTTTLASDVLAMVVASHHGFMDALTPDGQDQLTKRLVKDEAESRKNQALSLLPPILKRQLHELLEKDINGELTGFLRRSIGDNYGEEEAHFNISLIVRFLLSCLIDADRIDAADFDAPENLAKRQYGCYVEWTELITRLEGHIASFGVRHEIDILRRDVSEKCLAMARQERGFFRLTVPTGGGKTLASLRFALHHAKQHGMQRVIFIIPYTSIIDQNAASIRKALGVDSNDIAVVLEHHSNLMPDRAVISEKEEVEAKQEHGQYKVLAENWDSPIILTTMVQFMETLYSAGTNSCRRMHQLANSVIIFDEIQTLPINLIHLFNLATKFLVNACRSSIMLCTATQPILHAVEPPSRSLPYDRNKEISVTEGQRRKTLERSEIFDVTRPSGWSRNEIADLAQEECNDRKSVLIIVNTKREAREIFWELSKAVSLPIYHLSTSMCPSHRMEKLDEIRKLLEAHEKRPFILVSTQLIEAGVDVDFDVVIRSLAGLDSLAQAAGRCNRHGSKPYKGRVFLINSRDERLSNLPSIALAQKETLRVLEEYRRDTRGHFQGHLLSDPTLERYFQYYFYTRSGLMDYPVTQNSPVGRSDTLVELLSSNRRSLCAYGIKPGNPKLKRYLNQSFRAAAECFEVITDSGQGVIVPYGDGEEIIENLCSSFEPSKQYRLLRYAQRFSVNCFSYELEQLSKQGALREVQQGSGILCLHETHYHDQLGVTTEKSRSMSVSIV